MKTGRGRQGGAVGVAWAALSLQTLFTGIYHPCGKAFIYGAPKFPA